MCLPPSPRSLHRGSHCDQHSGSLVMSSVPVQIVPSPSTASALIWGDTGSCNDSSVWRASAPSTVGFWIAAETLQNELSALCRIMLQALVYLGGLAGMKWDDPWRGTFLSSWHILSALEMVARGDREGFMGARSCTIWGLSLRERLQNYKANIRNGSEYLFRGRKVPQQFIQFGKPANNSDTEE